MTRRLLIVLALLGSGSTFASEGKTPTVEKEVNCLALNIYHEARGEPVEGQLAVAYVTMNRVASPRYPDTVCDVVWQDRQFSWTQDGRSDKPKDATSWDRAQRIATFIYKNYFRFIELARGATDVTRGALFYYAPKKVSPEWARAMVATTSIGSHVFLKDPKKDNS